MCPHNLWSKYLFKFISLCYNRKYYHNFRFILTLKNYKQIVQKKVNPIIRIIKYDAFWKCNYTKTWICFLCFIQMGWWCWCGILEGAILLSALTTAEKPSTSWVSCLHTTTTRAGCWVRSDELTLNWLNTCRWVGAVKISRYLSMVDNGDKKIIQTVNCRKENQDWIFVSV